MCPSCSALFMRIDNENGWSGKVRVMAFKKAVDSCGLVEEGSLFLYGADCLLLRFG